MNLIKTLVKEELTIFNESVKLTKETLSLIENQDYVKYVLGINVSLNESQSFETKQLILQEALNLQSLSQSIQKYVGDKVNTVITGVKDVKDVLKIIYQIATDATGELAKKGELILKKTIEETLNTYKQKIQGIESKLGTQIQNFKEVLDNLTNKVVNLVKKLESYTGLAGILGLLAFATLLQWVNQKILGVAADFIKNNGIETLKKAFDSFGAFFKEIFGQLSIDNIIGYFKNFDGVLGPIVNTAEIITIMAVILRPIVQKFNLNKKLNESLSSLINEAKEHTDDEIVDFNEIDLQHEYNKLNSLLFKGNLQPVTMLWNKRKGAHGVVKGTRNRRTGKITLTSLSMSQFLKVPYKFFKDVLAHEMIHVFWMQQDVNAKHGPLFVREMNRINSMGLGFNVSVTSDSSETSKFEISQDIVKQGIELVFLLMRTDKEKNMLSVMKYDAYKKEAHKIIDIFDYLVNKKNKYRFAEGEFFLSTNPKLQSRKIQRSFGSVSYTIIDDSLVNEFKQNAKFLCKFEIGNTYGVPQVEGPDQPNPAPPKGLLGMTKYL
jgi:hypothetical protein